MLPLRDAISNQKFPNIHLFERVFVKVEFTAVLAEDASMSSVIHQFDHRTPRASLFSSLPWIPLSSVVALLRHRTTTISFPCRARPSDDGWLPL